MFANHHEHTKEIKDFVNIIYAATNIIKDTFNSDQNASKTC